MRTLSSYALHGAMEKRPFTTITVYSACRLGEAKVSMSWPPAAEEDGPSAAAANDPLPTASEYKTMRRSPYSVLRSRRTSVGVCTSRMLQSEDSLQTPTLDCTKPWCMCSALLYREEDGGLSGDSDTAVARDTLALALFLCGAMDVLRGVLGEAATVKLLGPSGAGHSQPVALCADPSPLLDNNGATHHWSVRRLLTNDEENRLKWLLEESCTLARCYSRAPTLRALFVMWRIAASSEADPGAPLCSPPTLKDITQIVQRMGELMVPCTLCDVAALAALAAANVEVESLLFSQLTHLLNPVGSSSPPPTYPLMAEAGADEAAAARLLAATLLYQCMQRHTQAVSAVENSPRDLLSLLTAASACQQGLVSASLPSPTEVATVAVVDVLQRGTRAILLGCNLPTGSPHLVALSTWLLREEPTSECAYRHFKRLVQHDPTAAMTALEVGNGSSDCDLPRFVHRLLPLVEHSGSEEFFDAVVRDIIVRLEDRLRRVPMSFSREDLSLISQLGTHLFAVNASDASSHGWFDGFAWDRVEELHVMDGSPWALCVSTYRSLREMIRGLARDHSTLKRQVQEPMQSIAGDSTKTSETVVEAPESPSTAPTAMEDQRPLPVSPAIRQQFLYFVEELVKALVDESGINAERPIVVSSELFAFVNQHVPVPNIQDEYRRKIFLLVNVAEDPKAVWRRRKEREKRLRQERAECAEAVDDKSHRPRTVWVRGHSGPAAWEASETEEEGSSGSEAEIPAELRFLVSSLPLTLSPWASVMILREVLAKSAGKNPRYTYVLNAAIDLQLPISTTRSRIATTLNMWRFLNSQSHKLTLKESVVMRQRCVLNLPLSYILSSYWSLITWLTVAGIIMLNVVGLDFESQLVTNSLFQLFAPWAEVVDVELSPWHREAASDIASDYFQQDEIAHRYQRMRSTNTIVSSASYLFLGYDDQRRPMAIIPVGSDPRLPREVQEAEEYACAAAALRELSLHVPFPFYLDLERPMPVEYLEMRVAERIRRVSFNNTWFLPRMIIRTFPLGRQYTERSLLTHTCAQANLTRRRITFLLYIHDGVPVSPHFLRNLQQSLMATNANLVLVTHERSLRKGHTTPDGLESLMGKVPGGSDGDGALRVLPFCRALHDVQAPASVAISEFARRFGRRVSVQDSGWWPPLSSVRAVISQLLLGRMIEDSKSRVEGDAPTTHPVISVPFASLNAALERTSSTASAAVRRIVPEWNSTQDTPASKEEETEDKDVPLSHWWQRAWRATLHTTATAKTRIVS